jgi:U2 small nuclear ribonucleoprotein B''
MLFSTYGSVLDVVALKTMKMRGQAHVTFKDVSTATQALRHLDGFEFFGKPVVSSPGIASDRSASLTRVQRIQYARSKSDFIAKLDGTFKVTNPDSTGATTAGGAPGDAGTALQQSVFGGAPGKGAVPTAGIKRPRDDDEEEEEEEEDVPMEEDEDEAEMDMDESDDD